MRPRSKSFINKADLQTSLGQYIQVYNSRLTKKFSTCKIVEDDQQLKGGIKLNFNLEQSVPVHNLVKLDEDYQEEFFTYFKFSSKAKLVVPMSIHNNVLDLVAYVVTKFRIVLEEAQHLQIFERELSVSQQDIFFRKLADEEHPLELFMLWKINGERKTFVLTDHDPNEKKYGKCTMAELEQRLANLDSEESEVVESLIENYSKAKNLIDVLLKK